MEGKNKTISIAIIEDNPDFLAAFNAMISGNNDLCLLGIATDCASAQTLLQGNAADVLLVDLELPDGNGITLIKQATTRWPNCDVMVVSVFGNQQNVLAALAAGATGYLLKDSDSENLAKQIRILKAGGSPISPVIARQLLTHLNTDSLGEPSKQESAPERADGISLSKQEKNVLTLASKGYNYDEVAEKLGVTRHTVATYVKRCYGKLQVNSKTAAIYEARRHGLVQD